MQDNKIINDEEQIVRKQRKNSFFYSASDTFKFLAAIFTTTSFAILLPAISGVKAVAATATAAAVAGSGIAGGLTFTAACAALTTVAPIGLVLLGAAALVTGLAIGAQYVASRNYQSANLDSFEMNAKHTAKYMVKELKGNNMCLVDQEPKRADGKSWATYTQTRACDKSQGAAL